MDQQDFEAAVAAEVSKRLRMTAEVLQVKLQRADGLVAHLLRYLAHVLEEACGPAPAGSVNERVRHMAATSSAPTCASCGGPCGGCYVRRKSDGKEFCLNCKDAASATDPNPPCGFPHLDSPAPTPPPVPQPPRSRCCNTYTFTAEGRTICSRCRLGCRTR